MKKTRFNPREIRKINDQDRMWFVRYWAHYVKTHPDKDWSSQQNILINSILRNARQLSPAQYLKLKKEPCLRKDS